jgi:aerobic-type carbon monoxide dehydrogenase small subunit (CoxS/CutS family)
MARAASSRKGAAGKPARKRLPKLTKPVAKKPVRSATRVVAAAHEAPGGPAAPSAISIRVNGQTHSFELGRDLTPSMTLSWVLREKLGLTGVKVACDEGACGACTILLDGKAVLSCMMLAVEAAGRDILTIEGLARTDPVVEAFACQCEPGYGTALQCGICTPGFVMAARALLDENPRPTMDEVKEALSGNLCRCGCYSAIAQAVQHASERTVAKGGGR